jgi:predicted HD phosphohydrolase
MQRGEDLAEITKFIKLLGARQGYQSKKHLAVMSLSIETDPSHAERVAQDLVILLEVRGTGDYIGESISQLEPSLQCAHYAKQAGSYTLRMSCY